jgi:hypothetical protein
MQKEREGRYAERKAGGGERCREKGGRATTFVFIFQFGFFGYFFFPVFSV